MNPSSPYSTLPQAQTQQSINPALLGGFQSGPMAQKYGASVNPSQFMNGMGVGMGGGMSSPMNGMNMNAMGNNMSMGSISAAQLLHQQQQIAHQRSMMNGSMAGSAMNPMMAGAGGMGMGGNMMNMGPMNPMMSGGGMSPSHPNNSIMGPSGGMMGMDMSSPMNSGMSPTSNNYPMNDPRMPNPSMSRHPNNTQNSTPNPMSMNSMPMMSSNSSNMPMSNMGMGMGGGTQQMAAMLTHMGISRDQYSNMSPQDRQMVNSKMMLAIQQSRDSQLGQHFDRPSSSAGSNAHNMTNPSTPSNGMNAHPMMPPSNMAPPPRPPTAQSHRSANSMPGPSRPGTAMDMRPRTTSSMGSPPPNPNQRPPSRATSDMQAMSMGMGMGMNGYPHNAKPPSTPQIPQPHQGSPPPPGSPSPYGIARPGTTTGNRPMPGSPNMSSGGMSGVNGFPPPPTPQRMSPRPVSAMGSSGIGGVLGMGALNMGINGVPMGQPSPAQTRPPSVFPSQATQQHLPGGSGLLQDATGQNGTPSRQPSLPPTSGGNMPPSIPSMPSTSGINTPSRIPSAAPSAASVPPAPSTPAARIPPLPANVSLNPTVTRVTVVPLINSTKVIPELSKTEIEDIQGWMKVDKEYEDVYRKMKERMSEELRRDVFGPTKANWWEKGSLSVNSGVLAGKWRNRREIFDVRYPNSRRKDRDSRGRKIVRREGLRLPRKLSPTETDRPEQLVPIRLEFDVEHHKMRDTFVWNLNDPVVTPENFAQSLVEDYKLPSTYHSVITRSIQDQLSDFKAHSNNYDGEGGEFFATEDSLRAGCLDERDAEWWESWRKRLRSEYLAGRTTSRKKRKVSTEEDGADRPMDVDEIVVDDNSMHEDMRILIKLDITVGSMKLDDQFEWDLRSATSSPEEFAEVYAKDLGLAGEFKTAIAHSIREQIQAYQKSLFLVGHPSDSSAIQDEDLKTSFLPSLSSGARPLDQVSSFTPLLNYVSDGEIDRNEKEREKEMNKRRKRNTRGKRGVVLPDREPVRTYRTPAIGFPELDPATAALAAAANAPVSRRAAAAAASLTIANMVASENGTPITPQHALPTAPQPTPTAPKKKPLGLFKAPPIPSSVLRPRAHRDHPVPSWTAADVSTLPVPLDNDPPVSVSAPERTKTVSVRRAKELEREAKEREFADGQHNNMIDGVWHCSNCGCPESIAVGRRKGPLGDKSQCGTCGKYWHRHRRPRPVDYHTDPEYHQGLIRDAEMAKIMARKKGGAAALRAQAATAPTTPADSEPQTPRLKEELSLPTIPPSDDRALSPVSTTSSASESPLAQKVKINGTSHPAHPMPLSPLRPSPRPPPSKDEPPASTISPSLPENQMSPTKTVPPDWLSAIMLSTKAKYPNDLFDITLRKVTADSPAEWRLKCTDCPGKLYKPGPGESLSNFEVHLKNRHHRQRVDDRVGGGQS